MANGAYKLGMQAMLNAEIDWNSDTIKAVLIDTGTYTVNLTTHDFYNDLSGVVGTAVTLTSPTIALGVFDAADVVFSAVTGNSAEAIVIFKDTGNVATSNLLFYIDTVSAGLPVTPNSGDITIVWNASGIFAIA